MIRLPSRPRLIRPDFSVMHSPRLTNKKGVLTRIAPARIASGTPQFPKPVSATQRLLLLKEFEAPVVRLACENHNKDCALQNIDGRIGQSKSPLQQSATGGNAAKQNGDRHNSR